MAKATLEFNLEEPFEAREFKRAARATDAWLVLWDVANEVFRPARKHGYNNPKLQELLDNNEDIEDAIWLLEEMFYEIMSNHGVSLDDLD